MSLRIPVAGKDYELNLPKEHLSVSQVEEYQRCGEHYRRSRIEGVPTGYSATLLEGHAHHHVHALSCQAKKERGTHLTLSEANASFEGYLKGHEDEVTDWDTDLSTILARCEQWYGVYYAPFGGIHMIEDPQLIEEEWTREWAGVKVIGFADVVASKVWDLKVSGSRKIDTKHHFQLNTYRVVYQRPAGIVQFYKGRKVADCEIRIHKGDHRLDLKKVEEMVISTVANVAMGISKEVFVPINPQQSWLCQKKYCPFYMECYGGKV